MARFLNTILQTVGANGENGKRCFTIRSSWQDVAASGTHNMFDFKLRNGWKIEVMRVVGEKEDTDIVMRVLVGGAVKYTYTGAGTGTFDEYNSDDTALASYTASGDEIVRPQYKNNNGSAARFCEGAFHFIITPP